MLQLLHESEQESESATYWSALPRGALGLLREAETLRQIASIIGPAALTDQQQWTYYAANLVKDGFLQQNALDPIDTFCPPEKQILLAALFIGVYQRGRCLVEQGVSCQVLTALPALTRLKRARAEIPNDRIDLLEKLRDEVDLQLTEAGKQTSAPEKSTREAR
jgi:V/A-type H+-transporting ATPase subunit A